MTSSNGLCSVEVHTDRTSSSTIVQGTCHRKRSANHTRVKVSAMNPRFNICQLLLMSVDCAETASHMSWEHDVSWSDNAFPECELKDGVGLFIRTENVQT